MVEFSANHQMTASLDDIKADILAMAQAFRAASDDDTRNVMTAMTNQTPQALESLKFFVVTKSWFVRAWPLLTAKPTDSLDDAARVGDDLTVYIGKIQNSELVDSKSSNSTSMDEKDEQGEKGAVGTTSSTDETSTNNGITNAGNPQEYDIVQSKQNISEYYRRISENPETTRMKSGLVHTKDFFFLGPSAWMLVKEKFGYDGYEISRCCKKVISRTIGQGRIEIALLPGEETIVNGASGTNKDLVSTLVPLSGRFPYEKVFTSNDNGASYTNTIKSRKAAFLSEISRSKQTEEKDDSAQPILLLPPSTTNFQEENKDAFGPLYEASNMELETTENGGYDDSVVPQVSGRKRLSSGLSNMGNTCFMNSTLQCLAHTENLRRYFLSGEYKKDLNRDNPLGTGGELATQFASLLGEMWGDNSNRRNVMGGTQSWKYSNSSLSNAVYPRNFKNSLGKHAEQFMGYDQHDSQELATYLLDALHEDTNRVTKKPYVEKPEQEENESDADAADKAWEMHLRREDSRVLENFMGQVKSRLECCVGDCPRVSTTFDPFMYLSVPIPGENERTLEVTFVPMNPNQKMQKLALALAKTATVAELLQKMNEELVRIGICEEAIPLQDLSPVEVYEKEIFKWHDLADNIEGIKEFDQTFVYQLQSLEEIRNSYTEDDERSTAANDLKTSRKIRTKLDLESSTELEKGDRWKDELARFSKNRLFPYRLVNATRSTTAEKIEYLTKLDAFLNEWYLQFDKDETSGSKRTNGGEVVEGGTQGVTDQSSLPFSGVRTKYDVAVLEFCAEKLRQFIVDLMDQEKEDSREGILIQLGIRQAKGPLTDYTSRNGSMCNCLVLRLPSNLSVYGLREELARRLSRSLIQDEESADMTQKAKSAEFASEESERKTDSSDFYIKLLRTLILCFDNKGRGSTGGATVLGMVSEDDDSEGVVNGDKLLFAVQSNEKEQARVASTVNNRGRIYLYLDEDDDRKVFDGDEFDSVDDRNTSSSKESKPDISVLDCIENYCKKEQLEESDMWYCNQCKEHVRAWKQFHLYRTPPILIIHLKRFYFSASTHRRDKITRKIDFPLEGLDLTNLVACYEEDAKPIYDCYAVSNHFGGLGGGHYTAYTLSDDGVWCNYDDSRVTTDIDPKEVVSEAAYVLYYRRRDVPVGEDRNIIVDTQLSPMICEPADNRGEVSEISSNNTAQPGDMDLILDDTDSNGSSKTAISLRIDDYAEERPLQ